MNKLNKFIKKRIRGKKTVEVESKVAEQRMPDPSGESSYGQEYEDAEPSPEITPLKTKRRLNFSKIQNPKTQNLTIANTPSQNQNKAQIPYFNEKFLISDSFYLPNDFESLKSLYKKERLTKFTIPNSHSLLENFEESEINVAQWNSPEILILLLYELRKAFNAKFNLQTGPKSWMIMLILDSQFIAPTINEKLLPLINKPRRSSTFELSSMKSDGNKFKIKNKQQIELEMKIDETRALIKKIIKVKNKFKRYKNEAEGFFKKQAEANRREEIDQIEEAHPLARLNENLKRHGYSNTDYIKENPEKDMWIDELKQIGKK